MNVPKAWLQILCLVSVFGQLYCNIDTKEYFCGKKLVRTLTELCSIYNNPTIAHPHSRFRRQIVEECCRSQCSRRYLVQYYCEQAKSPIAKLLQANPEPPGKAAHEKDPNAQSDHSASERNSLIVGTTEESTNQNALPPKSESLPSDHDKITHKRRPCKCRKRRAKRKKKLMKFPSLRNAIHNRQPANIGHVEHSQTPFYVWRLSRMY